MPYNNFMSERKIHTEAIPQEQLPKNLMEIARSLGLEGEDARAYVRAIQSGKGLLITTTVKQEGRTKSKIDSFYDPSTGAFSSEE